MVITPKTTAFLLSRGELLLFVFRDRVIVFVEAGELRMLVTLVVWHKEVGSVDHKDPLGVVSPEGLEIRSNLGSVPAPLAPYPETACARNRGRRVCGERRRFSGYSP